MSEKLNLTAYLPAVFQRHDYLGQFLEPFEEAFQEFVDLLDGVDRYFSPVLTDREFLPWLATWLALIFDETWQPDQQRQLISEAVTLYKQRGTIEGLRRYLEIYTDYEPDIREMWPGGMQIGVASRLGGIEGDPVGFPRNAKQIVKMHHIQNAPHDIIVADGILLRRDLKRSDCESRHAGNPCADVRGGKRLRMIYLAHRISKVSYTRDPESGRGRGWIDHSPDGTACDYWCDAIFTRRSGLANNRYELTLDGSDDPVAYIGDTFLIKELQKPYCFTVAVNMPEYRADLDKVRAIVELEKPAHTMCYLKLKPKPSPTASSMELEDMGDGPASAAIDTLEAGAAMAVSDKAAPGSVRAIIRGRDLLGAKEVQALGVQGVTAEIVSNKNDEELPVNLYYERRQDIVNARFQVRTPAGEYTLTMKESDD